MATNRKKKTKADDKADGKAVAEGVYKYPNSRTESGYSYQARYYYKGHLFQKGGFIRKEDAIAWRNKNLGDISQGTYETPAQRRQREAAEEEQRKIDGYTFKDYWDYWIENSEIKYSTKRAYKSCAKTHLIPKWGNVPLKAITREAIEHWRLYELAPQRAGARKHANDLFRAVLNTALDRGLIDTNPAAIVSRAKQKGRGVRGRNANDLPGNHTPRPVTTTELHKLAEALPENYRALVYLLAYSGLRIGEARALRRSDIDFEEKTISISRNVTGDGMHRSVEDTPKTDKSTRVIPMVETVAEELRRHIAAGYSQSGRHGLVFTSPQTGDYMNYGSFYEALTKYCRKLEIPRISPHDFRHTTASLLASEGTPEMIIQEILGHTTSKMTRRYVSAYEEEKRAALEAITKAKTGLATVTPISDGKTA